jgi:tRNA 2-thiouridine synthesizing protein A
MNAKVFDFKGLQCPLPIIKTAKAIKEIAVGDEIRVIVDDPAAKSDFDAWSKQTGNKIIEITEKQGAVEFLLKRGP